MSSHPVRASLPCVTLTLPSCPQRSILHDAKLRRLRLLRYYFLRPKLWMRRLYLLHKRKHLRLHLRLRLFQLLFWDIQHLGACHSWPACLGRAVTQPNPAHRSAAPPPPQAFAPPRAITHQPTVHACVRAGSATHVCYSSGIRYSASCSPCAAGTFRSLEKDEGRCESCAPGKYSGSRASICATCAPGTYSGSGWGKCEPCASGKFQPNPGRSSCLDCAQGTWSARSDSGTVSCTQCVGCPAGETRGG